MIGRYGEQCYCGAHGSSSGLPPSAGVWQHQHAPICRFAWAEGIERHHPTCSLCSKTSPNHSISLLSIQASMRTSSYVETLYFGYFAGPSLSAHTSRACRHIVLCGLKLTAQTTWDVQSLLGDVIWYLASHENAKRSSKRPSARATRYQHSRTARRNALRWRPASPRARRTAAPGPQHREKRGSPCSRPTRRWPQAGRPT